MRKMNWAITTSYDPSMEIVEKAKDLCEEHGVRFITRGRKTLEEIKEEYSLEALAVLDRREILRLMNPELFWHPSMAIPRLRSVAEGRGDHLLKALQLLEGESVLDCTLGLGSDALVEALGVGEKGSVVALESSPAICAVTKWGMEHRSMEFNYKKSPVGDLAKRITIIQKEALEYLKEQEDNSFDHVYFDPMFKAHVEGSCAIDCLMDYADFKDFDEETLQEALRVARRSVVLKERPFSKIFEKLNCTKKAGGRYSNVCYGIWEKREKI